MYYRPQMASDNNMASGLKRKRGQLEVVESSKRSRYNQNIPPFVSGMDISKAGYAPSFGHNNGHNGKTNGVETTEAATMKKLESAKVEDLGALAERAQAAKQKGKKSKMETIQNPSTWKTSDPIGGRMIEVDPIFAGDEK